MGLQTAVETVERLYQFIDGELTDERRHQIERHLDECSPCLQAVGFERELRDRDRQPVQGPGA